MKNRLNRFNGFTIVEMLIGLAILATVITSVILMQSSVTASYNSKDQRMKIEELGRAIQKTAQFIAFAYSNLYVCGFTPPTPRTDWGWRGKFCNDTTLFPVLSSSSNNMLQLKYTLNLDIIQNGYWENALLSNIKQNFNFCNVSISDYTQASENSLIKTITITCPFATDARYCVANMGDCKAKPKNGLKTQAHIPGTSYNFIDEEIISLVVEYNEFTPKGVVKHLIDNNTDNISANDAYYVDFTDFNNTMLALNKKKAMNIINAIKKYEVTKRLMEASGGLPENDDYFIPWVWQLTARPDSGIISQNIKQSIYITCEDLKSNGDLNCTMPGDLWNLWYFTDSSDISGCDNTCNMLAFLQFASIHLFGNDPSLMFDVYGNPLALELIIDPAKITDPGCGKLYTSSDPAQTNCNPTQYNNYCNCIKPASGKILRPHEGYGTKAISGEVLPPPFIGYLYSEFCYNLGTKKYDNKCRFQIVYAN